MFLYVYGRDTTKSRVFQPVNLKTGNTVGRISMASKIRQERKKEALEALEEIQKELSPNIELQLRNFPDIGPPTVFS